jgi:twitching motility two-component system response regulator PilH
VAIATILVVDDSPTDLRRLVEPLRHSGYRILTARDGDQALALALREQPQLVLLDAVLPRRNGFRVCRELKSGAHTAGGKVLLLTGKSFRDDGCRTSRINADAYLSKPVDADELLNVVSRLLGS